LRKIRKVSKRNLRGGYRCKDQQEVLCKTAIENLLEGYLDQADIPDPKGAPPNIEGPFPFKKEAAGPFGRFKTQDRIFWIITSHELATKGDNKCIIYTTNEVTKGELLQQLLLKLKLMFEESHGPAGAPWLTTMERAEAYARVIGAEKPTNTQTHLQEWIVGQDERAAQWNMFFTKKIMGVIPMSTVTVEKKKSSDNYNKITLTVNVGPDAPKRKMVLNTTNPSSAKEFYDKLSPPAAGAPALPQEAAGSAEEAEEAEKLQRQAHLNTRDQNVKTYNQSVGQAKADDAARAAAGLPLARNSDADLLEITVRAQKARAEAVKKLRQTDLEAEAEELAARKEASATHSKPPSAAAGPTDADIARAAAAAKATAMPKGWSPQLVTDWGEKQ